MKLHNRHNKPRISNIKNNENIAHMYWSSITNHELTIFPKEVNEISYIEDIIWKDKNKVMKVALLWLDKSPGQKSHL